MLIYISSLIDLKNDIESLQRRAKVTHPIFGNGGLDKSIYEPLFEAISRAIDKDLSLARADLDNAKFRHSERKKRHSENDGLKSLAEYEANQ